MSTKQILGLLGSALLFFGSFLPVVTGIFGMTQSFFQVSALGGPLIFLLAVVSTLLAFQKKYGGLVVTGVAALLLISLVYVLTNYQLKSSSGFGALLTGTMQMCWFSVKWSK